MFDIIPPQYKMAVAIAGVVLLMGVEAYFVRDYYVMQGEAKVAKINSDNQQAQIEHLGKIRTTESALLATKTQLEKNNVEYKKTISANHTYYTDYIAKHGLRDPGSKTPAGSVPCSAGDVSCATRPSENNLISRETGKFLFDLAAEADALRIDYGTCMEWAAKAKLILDRQK